ncbi:hypothetical protein BZG01_19765 [Labilibaculum manganireducens]|uniref:Peptidoglycan binding-like domain-containing protein n=1 Tax=Labilibaculum manganireducens TaxID=1940525 RepID=A0A2N3HT03_9BACT|nr:peptidoglycan-binding domain-containing protein [Labilibaculum manganireducens]PKQ61188.1 hypothetical protein BZG01_19765 [Labilibaculum manganireducens]
MTKTSPEVPDDCIYDPILNQSRKRYPWKRDFEYDQEEKEEEEYTPFPISNKVYHFHPVAFVEQMRRMNTIYRKGDKGALILELNFRLAGFGGMLPTEEFTELTEKGVKQFQADYMKITPTGEVDSKTLKKIDEFSDKYRENINNYKCNCGICSGFGQGQYKDEYKSTSKIERHHKYEYPGIHQSLLWAVSASQYYLSEKLEGEYKINSICSGYRCHENNKQKGRSSTNHMGKAVDLHFNKNGTRTKDVTDMDLLREKIYCEYAGAPKNNGNFGWERNKFGLESSLEGAKTWIHIDVREFKDMLKDEFFIKASNDKYFSKKINEVTKTKK